MLFFVFSPFKINLNFILIKKLYIIQQYNDTYLSTVLAPLKALKLDSQFDIVAFVKGGGLTGQAESIQLGVARQLCKINAQHRTTLKPYGFLTRDSRIKERKKYGLRKARKAPQYSKR